MFSTQEESNRRRRMQLIFTSTCLYIIALPQFVLTQSSSTVTTGSSNQSLIPSVYYTLPTSTVTMGAPDPQNQSGSVTDNITTIYSTTTLNANAPGNETPSGGVTMTSIPLITASLSLWSTSDVSTPSTPNLSPEAIVGIVVGGAAYIVVMILIVYIICWCIRRRRNSMSASSGLPVFPDPNLYGQQPRITNAGKKKEVGRYQRQLDEYSITDFVVDVIPKDVARQVRAAPSPVKTTGNVRPAHRDVIRNSRQVSLRDQISNRHPDPRSPLERQDSFDY